MNHRLTAVVCRDYRQYRNWCHDNGRNPRDPSLRLVLEEHHARGYKFDAAVFLGGSSYLAELVEARVRRKATA